MKLSICTPVFFCQKLVDNQGAEMLLALLHVAVLACVDLGSATSTEGKPALHRCDLPESHSSLGIRMTIGVCKAPCEVCLGCNAVDT